MDVTLPALLACMDLTEVGGEADPVAEGTNLDIGYHRVFGGQILAQLVTVASAIAPDKSVKSLTVAFPREGNADLPMRYRTTVHQQGRTFATVGIIGFQVDPEKGERTVAVALASLHIDEDGPHHSAGPPHLGGPAAASPREIGLIPWEIAVVGDVELDDRAAADPRFEWWMRAPALAELSMEAHPMAHYASTVGGEGAGRALAVDQALLAHATDLTIIGTALRAIDGLSEADSTTKIATAVTSHSLWFHQPFRLDEWLLLVQEGPVVARGRAFGRGDVFQGDQLVASFAQESMVRPLSP